MAVSLRISRSSCNEVKTLISSDASVCLRLTSTNDSPASFRNVSTYN